MGDWTKRGTTGQYHCTCAGHVGGGRRDDHAGEISRSAADGCAEIGLAKRRRRLPWVTGHFVIFFAISDHFKPPHSSFPPFLDPLNSFPWSLFADFSLFGSYDENKVGQRLDRIFRPPQRLRDQGNGTDAFLVSWAFH